ncbi:MAG TPA: alpha/beta hydrolase [Humisphaera sp.]
MEVAGPSILLLPGLSGDPRVVRPQLAAFPTLTVPRWLPPASAAEPLPVYAARLARAIDPGRPCLVGGVSFGGIVALELARHLQAKACLLIASCRDVGGRPTALRLLRPLEAVTPMASLGWATTLGGATAASVMPPLRRRLNRVSPEVLAFRTWALRALLAWRPTSPPCPVLQIYGDRDSTFAVGRSRADAVIRGAGHMLTLTHPEQVNAFIRTAVERLAA